MQLFCVNWCDISCTKSLPRTRILFFLLLSCEELLLKSAPKIIQFLPSPLPKLNSPCLLNPMLYQLHLYLSIPAFLVKLTAPNKQFSNVG